MTETFFDDAPRSESGLSSSADQTPRLWWRPPGHTEVFTLIPDAAGTSTFHFAPFDATTGAPEMTWRGHAVKASAPEPGTLPHVATSDGHETSRDEHRANVEAALAAIEAGDLDKVVVSRTHVTPTHVAPETAFQNLCAMHPRALVYLMHHPVAHV